MDLWIRCKNYGALPNPGGVLDQPAYMMRLLDMIDFEVEKHNARKRQKEEALRGIVTPGMPAFKMNWRRN